ncbi:MAG: S41 family peptidase [Pseudomonadota bacterium]
MKRANNTEATSLSRPWRHIGFSAVSVCSLAFLVACGGGGVNREPSKADLNDTGPRTPTGPGGFKSACAAPAFAGETENDAFKIQQEALRGEFGWLRNWTNETYFWSDDVVDVAPTRSNDQYSYFLDLKTDRRTLSGRNIDTIRFSQNTDQFRGYRSTELRLGFGLEIVPKASGASDRYYISYVTPGSPAAATDNIEFGLMRGAQVLSVNGTDVTQNLSLDDRVSLQTSLFPSRLGEKTTFEVMEPGASKSNTITLTAEKIAPKPVGHSEAIATTSGTVGYVLINSFNSAQSESAVKDAISVMADAGISDLVLDLRYNSGGSIAVASQLSFMVAGSSKTAGRAFEQLRFKDGAGLINPVTGNKNEIIPFYNRGIGLTVEDGTPLPSLDLARVFILSSTNTCSTSEAVINGLRGVDIKVILIGEGTCGKPFGGYPTDNCGVTYLKTQFQAENDRGFGDYLDGFIPENSTARYGVRVPGCEVVDDYQHELGDKREILLKTALSYRETGKCPATGNALGTFVGFTDKKANAGLVLSDQADIMHTNRDMHGIK